MAGLFPLSRMQQLDANGELLAGARLFLFDGGTSTPRIGYKDSSLTSPHTNPIIADSAGRLPLIYLEDGFYRQRLTTSTGLMVFDDDGLPVLSSTSGGSGTSVDPNAIFKSRDIKIRWDDQPLAGYVRLNGRSIGSVSSGATERANADTQPLYEELWPYTNIVVTGGKGASAAADYAANKPLVLPDCAGRGLFGMDDMGAGAKGRITAFSVATPAVVGSVGGLEKWTITTTQLPAYTISVTGTISLSGTTASAGEHQHSYSGTTNFQTINQSHSHQYSFPSSIGGIAGSGAFTNYWVGGVVSTATSTVDTDHQHTYSGTTLANGAHSHSVTLSGTPTLTGPSGGAGGATPTIAPFMLFMIYIRL